MTRTSRPPTWRHAHHPLEEEGVDFWWLDWQQGGDTDIPGLDPLWMLNHVHYLDSGRERTDPDDAAGPAGPGPAEPVGPDAPGSPARAVP